MPIPKNVNQTKNSNQSKNVNQKKDDKITGKNINLNKISLGPTEQKKSGKFNYQITPIFLDEKPFEIVESGKMKIFSFNKKTFSVGITVDKENQEYFKKIEDKITELYDSLELNLIKTSHDHSKVYAKLYAVNGEIFTPVRILSNGKKRLINPLNYVGIPFQGKVVLKISKIYEGSCLSLVCEAKEVLIEEIHTQPSYFHEHSDAEDDE